MKKNLLITAALMVAMTLFFNDAKAQTTPTGTAVVTIRLADAASITMGTNKDVLFEYLTPSDYAAAKEKSISSHFTVISTQAYGVSATGSGAFTGDEGTIDLDVLNIQVETADKATSANYPLIVAATSAKPVIVSAVPTTSTVFGVMYSIPDAQKLIGKAPGNYLASILYSFTQP